MRQALIILLGLTVIITGLGLARFERDVRAGYPSRYSSLSASFSRTFGLKMSVQVNYESKPVSGYKNTDIFLLSSLVIAL